MSSRSQTTIARSKSSPPRCVLPLVASTSKTPSFTRRIEMSNLPVLHLDLHDPVARDDFEREVAELLLDVLVPSPHEPLDGIDRRRGPPDEQPLGRLPDEDAFPRERHHRRQEHAPLRVGDHARESRRLVDVPDEAVRGPEVNADDS